MIIGPETATQSLAHSIELAHNIATDPSTQFTLPGNVALITGYFDEYTPPRPRKTPFFIEQTWQSNEAQVRALGHLAAHRETGEDTAVLSMTIEDEPSKVAVIDAIIFVGESLRKELSRPRILVIDNGLPSTMVNGDLYHNSAWWMFQTLAPSLRKARLTDESSELTDVNFVSMHTLKKLMLTITTNGEVTQRAKISAHDFDYTIHDFAHAAYHKIDNPEPYGSVYGEASPSIYRMPAGFQTAVTSDYRDWLLPTAKSSPQRDYRRALHRSQIRKEETYLRRVFGKPVNQQ